MAKTAANFTAYKVKANEMKNATKATNKTVSDARSEANKSIKKVNEVMKKLVDLLEQIDNLKTVNESVIAELEKSMKNLTRSSSTNGSAQVEGVNETRKIIKKSILTYTFDLERLKKEIAWAKKTYQSLPNFCPKKPVCVECKR